MEFKTVKTFKSELSKVHLFNSKSGNDLNSDKNNPMPHLPLVIHRTFQSGMTHGTKLSNATRSHHHGHY